MPLSENQFPKPEMSAYASLWDPSGWTGVLGRLRLQLFRGRGLVWCIWVTSSSARALALAAFLCLDKA